MAELRERLSRTENESTASVSKLQDVIQGLKERLKGLEKEKERALRDKENLMDEVSLKLHVEYQIDVHVWAFRFKLNYLLRVKRCKGHY